MAGDVIRIVGMTFMGRHGVHAWEQTVPQPFEIDVEARLDLQPAGAGDDLAMTVDYCLVYETARGVVQGPAQRLVETLAERIAVKVLSLGKMESVTVRVRKPRAALPGPVDTVEVEVTRFAGRFAGGPGRPPARKGRRPASKGPAGFRGRPRRRP